MVGLSGMGSRDGDGVKSALDSFSFRQKLSKSQGQTRLLYPLFLYGPYSVLRKDANI